MRAAPVCRQHCIRKSVQRLCFGRGLHIAKHPNTGMTCGKSRRAGFLTAIEAAFTTDFEIVFRKPAGAVERFCQRRQHPLRRWAGAPEVQTCC